MSSLSIPIGRKRHHFPEFRDSSDSEFPSKRCKNKDSFTLSSLLDVPIIFKNKLQQMTNWFWNIGNVNRFVRMALSCGASLPPPPHTKEVEDDSEEEEEEDDDDNADDDDLEIIDDVDIQEIKENVKQEKLYPLKKEFGKFHFSNDSGCSKQQQLAVNGSFSSGSLFNSFNLNGTCARELSTRYHGASNCSLRRKQTDKLKRKPLVSNPPTEIELFLGQEQPEVIAHEGDGIEILSESHSSKQKNTMSQKSFRSSLKSSSKISTPALKQSASNPVKKSGSSASKYYTANEVVRLQEKEQYKLLLETLINEAPYHPMRKKPQSDEENKNTSVFSTNHFRKQVLEQPIDSFIEKYYKRPCGLLPPKADKESSEKKKEEPPDEITIDDDDDDEVQVVNMKIPQYKAFFKSPLFTSDWLDELGKTMKSRTEEVNKIVEQHERKLEKIKKERQLRRLRVDVPVDKAVEAEFPELTPEIEDAINNVLYGGAAEDIICKSPSNCLLRRKDFETLTGLKWLNDNIINTFFELIVERSKNEGYPSVYAFNTYFYSKLKAGFSGIRRWTRKVDIFSYDINFVPLHVSYHWCLAVIDHRSRKIFYYDSMGNGEECCLEILREYLCLECKDKKGEILDPNSYSTETVADIPQQMNGSDCGMFTCRYAEYVSRDAKITFDQLQMQYFRRRTVYEIVTNQLL